MKKVFTILALALCIASQGQGQGQGHWQTNKKYYPFITVAAAPEFGNNNTWGAFEAGFGNKNTQFKVGTTSGNWSDKDNSIMLIGISRRFVYVHRLEFWGVLGTSQALSGRLPHNLSGQLLVRYQYDKAVNFFGGLGKSVWFPNPKIVGTQHTMGVQIHFRGNVHNL